MRRSRNPPTIRRTARPRRGPCSPFAAVGPDFFGVLTFAFRGSGPRAKATGSPGNLSSKLPIRHAYPHAVRAGGRRGPSGLFARDCRDRKSFAGFNLMGGWQVLKWSEEPGLKAIIHLAGWERTGLPAIAGPVPAGGVGLVLLDFMAAARAAKPDRAQPSPSSWASLTALLSSTRPISTRRPVKTAVRQMPPDRGRKQ